MILKEKAAQMCGFKTLSFRSFGTIALQADKPKFALSGYKWPFRLLVGVRLGRPILDSS